MTADRATRIAENAVPGAGWRVDVLTTAAGAPTAALMLRAVFPDGRCACAPVRTSSVPTAVLHECAEITRLATTLAECWVDGKVRA